MDKKILWVGFGTVLLIAGVTLASFVLNNHRNFHGVVYDPPVPASEIALKQANGQDFANAQSGKIVLIFFGFTNCQDVCPITMANLSQLSSQLGKDTDKVQVVFISVDPDRDTPAITQQYASQYNSSFIGLSGSLADLQKVWTNYGVYRELGQPDSNGNYEVTHTDRVLLIDQKGNLHLSYASDVIWQDMLYDIQILLK